MPIRYRSGLAIVREVAQAHGATVNIVTSPMDGARFVVSFESAARQSTVSPASNFLSAIATPGWSVRYSPKGIFMVTVTAGRRVR